MIDKPISLIEERTEKRFATLHALGAPPSESRGHDIEVRRDRGNGSSCN